MWYMFVLPPEFQPCKLLLASPALRLPHLVAMLLHLFSSVGAAPFVPCFFSEDRGDDLYWGVGMMAGGRQGSRG